MPPFVSIGDRWESFDAFTERHDNEVHGSETRACSEVMPSHRATETRQTLMGDWEALTLPHP